MKKFFGIASTGCFLSIIWSTGCSLCEQRNYIKHWVPLAWTKPWWWKALGAGDYLCPYLVMVLKHIWSKVSKHMQLLRCKHGPWWLAIANLHAMNSTNFPFWSAVAKQSMVPAPWPNSVLTSGQQCHRNTWAYFAPLSYEINIVAQYVWVSLSFSFLVHVSCFP